MPKEGVPEKKTNPHQEGVITFEAATETVRQNGYRLHERIHDKGGEDPKIYHTSEHPRTLDREEKRMAETLRLSSQQRAVTEIATAWHDTIIAYDKPNPENLLAMIRRHRGARDDDMPNGNNGNEAKSGRLMEEDMRRINQEAGKEIFSEEEIRTAIWAIDATYPDAIQGAPFETYPYYEVAIRQNPPLEELLEELRRKGITKGILFSQPHLEKPLEEGQSVPREVLVVALADLGGAGSSAPEEFLKTGNEEMRELYTNLQQPEILQRLAEGNEEADLTNRQKISEAFVNWLKSQVGFAAWQALRFEKIIHLLKQQNALRPEEEAGLRAQFSHYAENVRTAYDHAETLKTQTKSIKSTDGEKEAFLYLARAMGYEI